MFTSVVRSKYLRNWLFGINSYDMYNLNRIIQYNLRITNARYCSVVALETNNIRALNWLDANAQIYFEHSDIQYAVKNACIDSIIWFLKHTCLDTNAGITLVLDWAIMQNQLSIVKWVLTNPIGLAWDLTKPIGLAFAITTIRKSIQKCAYYPRIDIMDCLYEYGLANFTKSTLDDIVSRHYFNIEMWYVEALVHRLKFTPTEGEKHYLNILKWYHIHLPYGLPTPYSITSTAKECGFANVYKWMCELQN